MDDLSGPVSRRVAEVEQAFRDDYVRFQYTWVEFFVEHLSDVSRAFAGDLQECLLLAIVGQLALQARLAAGSEVPDPVRPKGITASRLADITGIPRETVRRKLVKLASRGWIERSGSEWRLTTAPDLPPARRDLQGLDSRGIGRVAALHCKLSSITKTRP
jgi:hypothetical protein